MVGINALVTSKASDCLGSFSDAQHRMLHYPTYRDTVFFEDERAHVGTTAYEKYPITCYEDLTTLIILEGMIYNISDIDIKKRLFYIAGEVRENPRFKDAISDFVADADGEFIAIILDKRTKNLCVFNDALGRLPLFWHMDDDILAISRELKFITHLNSSTSFDKIAIFEYLLYGFALGERTLIDGAERLLPATVLEYNGSNHTISKTQILPLSFNQGKTRRESSADAVGRLERAFMDGLQSRVEKCRSKKAFISLSGGLDSRAVLAGLDKCLVRPDGITYDTDPRNAKELEYTQKIADLFGVQLDHLAPPRNMTREDYSITVALCDAAQPMGLANVVSIEERIMMMHEEDDAIWYTGLYGGELLRYLNLTSGLSTDDDLVQFLLDTPDQYRYDQEKICAMTGLSEDELRQHLKKHIATYPEKDPYSKYAHFKFEKDYKWAGMGEDRNRFFFWTITPFYSKTFFTTAYTIDERKKNTLLFRNFLYSLDPRTCEVAYYNNGMALTRPLKLRIYGIAERAVRHPTIRRLASSIVRRNRQVPPPTLQQKDEDMRSWALELLEGSEHLKAYFSLPETRDVVLKEADSNMLQRLLTLFIYMDMVGHEKRASS